MDKAKLIDDLWRELFDYVRKIMDKQWIDITYNVNIEKFTKKIERKLSPYTIVEKAKIEELLKFIKSIKLNKHTTAGKRYEAECYIEDIKFLLLPQEPNGK